MGCSDNETGGFVGFAFTARCGDAHAKPPCLRSILTSTASMGFHKRFRHPRNNIWLKKNPWFEREVVPELRNQVKSRLR